MIKPQDRKTADNETTAMNRRDIEAHIDEAIKRTCQGEPVRVTALRSGWSLEDIGAVLELYAPHWIVTGGDSRYLAILTAR